VHQARIVASEHNAMSVLSRPTAQFAGHFKKIMVNLLIGRTENA
jgi:hypothetical protein